MTQEKILFLHIGPHRTASTYLQHILFKNRLMLESHSLLYPEPVHPENGHNNIFKDSINLNDVIEVKKNIMESNCKYALISSEELISHNPEEISVLFDKIKIVPVVCLRDFFGFAKSMWSILVSDSGYMHSLQDFFDSDILIKYAEKLLNWKNYFESDFAWFEFACSNKESTLTSRFLHSLERFDCVVPYDKHMELNSLVNFGLDIQKNYILLEFLRKIDCFQSSHHLSPNDRWYLHNFINYADVDFLLLPDKKYPKDRFERIKFISELFIGAYKKISNGQATISISENIQCIKFYKINAQLYNCIELMVCLFLRINRLPGGFNSSRYMELNTDLGDELSPENHWRRYGWNEARLYK